MKTIRITLLVILLPILLQAQQSTADLDKIFNNIIERGRVPGFGVSLFTEDSIIYNKGFGYSNIKSKKPYTKSTTQIVASISKTVVAVALMKAQEQGYLKLDDPINKHLPFKVNNPHFPDKEITIRHLAMHLSSLFYNEYMTDSLRGADANNKYQKLGDVLKSFLIPTGQLYKSKNWMKHPPGTYADYSNTGAALAAYIVEKSSGIPFEKFTAEQIFNPIGMHNTGWYSGKPDAQMTSYYNSEKGVPKREVLAKKDAIYPCGDLLSTSLDLSKFCQMILNKGIVNSKRVLSEKSIKEMLRFKKVKSEDKHKTTIGVFWGKSKNELGIPRKLIGHNGGEDYIYTMMYFDPKKKVGYIMLLNTNMTEEAKFHPIALIYQSLYRYGKYLKL